MSKSAKPSGKAKAEILVSAQSAKIGPAQRYLRSKCLELGVSISIKPLDGAMRISCARDHVALVIDLIDIPGARVNVA